MAHHSGLTGSQNSHRSSWHRSDAHDLLQPADARSLDGSSSTLRAASPASHLRKNSAPAINHSRSASAASEHARRLSLSQSLSKPLPQTPPQPNSAAAASEPPREVPKHDGSDSVPEHPRSRPPDPPVMDGRTSTMDSASSAASIHPFPSHDQHPHDTSSIGSISSTARRDSNAEDARLPHRTNGPVMASSAPASAPRQSVSTAPAHVGGPSRASSTHLSGLMCNVHRTSGREPPPLVGATTTILGDKLYVFGGRILSRSRPASLTADMYELDLIRRHWTKLETTGDAPPVRYFHSMCALGDTKMVCYGGMSPAPTQTASDQSQEQEQDQQQKSQQPEVTVMSDIYIFDVPTKKWTFVPAQDAPQGRYAHCACVMPSSATFSSTRAPLSALQHNPSAANPNEGRIGINIDGSGGAEMIVVGGQDSGNHYIEQISVFNLRSLKWTSTQPHGKSCGAYRSVTAPLSPALAARIGKATQQQQQQQQRPDGHDSREPGSSMLIYSNYNFLDVKLELQIRSPDGSLTERPMSGTYSPPGLRFPNGGIIDTHFVVSGTYLTSSKQEYALWALDLRTLTWSRIDAGGSVFSQGSWNRGVLWNRRNTFVILGNRKRSLVDDYNHRRINFSNVCMVELEAFGFYDNPRKTSPMSGFVSASSPYSGPGLSITRKAGYTAAGRAHSRASEELGEKALAMREMADMDILCIGGERIPVNSRIVARRWGPYFVQLLREGSMSQDAAVPPASGDPGLRPGLSNQQRSSSITITPGTSRVPTSETTTTTSSIKSGASIMSASASSVAPSFTSTGTSINGPAGAAGQGEDITPAAVNTAPTPLSLPPSSRPRCLYLPHTYLTVQALLHFVYTSSLPQASSPLCTPQILCSLLQIARPYRVDGLLEAVVERLHTLLDSRNAAAVFNATAMAAGGGRGIDGSLNPNYFVGSLDPILSPTMTTDFSMGAAAAPGALRNGASTPSPTKAAAMAGLARLNTANIGQPHSRTPSGELSATTSLSGSEWGSERGDGSETSRFVWNGELSSVIGLQKRGLRGLMEGRRMRERTGTGNSIGPSGSNGSPGYAGAGGHRMGLGIAGS